MSDLIEPGCRQIRLADVLHALSDSTRLGVVAQLAHDGEQLCGALDVSVAKSTLSQHLRVLRESGVTHTRPVGTQRWLSLRRDDLDQRFPGLLGVVLAALPTAFEDPQAALRIAPAGSVPHQHGSAVAV
ncbi:MAG: ArsR/SmtB family transcription factor [Sciscionella sp.]